MPATKRPRSPEPSESGSDDESEPAAPPLGDGGSDDDSQDTQCVDPNDPIAVATEKAKRGEWQEGDALPKHVYKVSENETRKKKYHLVASRGGKLQNFRDDDPNVLYRKLQEWHAKFDARCVPPTQKRAPQKRAEKQSGVDGVSWKPKARKWEGKVTDRVESAKQGKPVIAFARWFDKSKGKSGMQFDDQTECEQATIALRARLDTEFKTWLAERVAADPLVAGLPRGPADKKDWKEGVVYWVASQQDKWNPIRRAKFGNTCIRACNECNQQAVGDSKGGKKTHCRSHGGGPRCPGFGGVECQHGMSVNTGKKDNHDGMCVRCFCAAKPNDPRAARARSYVHAREQEVVKRLKELFPQKKGWTWQFDKCIQNRLHASGRRFRPDAMTVVEERVLIVEIDENSHRASFCHKEREREASLAARFPSRKVVMIRFNPDAYTDYNGVRHPSCFKDPTKDDHTYLDPDQNDQWEDRIKVLASTIRYVVNSDNELPPKQEDRPILMIELFYDNVMATAEDKRVAKEVRKFKAIGRRKRQAARAAKAAKAAN